MTLFPTGILPPEDSRIALYNIRFLAHIYNNSLKVFVEHYVVAWQHRHKANTRLRLNLPFWEIETSTSRRLLRHTYTD